jgi:hypothetical protein
VVALASSRRAPQHLERTCSNVPSSNAERIPTTRAATCANPELGGSHQGVGMTQADAVAPANENFGVVAASAYVDGRRVAHVGLSEAGEWARRPRHPGADAGLFNALFEREGAGGAVKDVFSLSERSPI